MGVYGVEVFGLKALETKFERAGAAAIDATVAMEKVYLYLLEYESKVFSSEGRWRGGSWEFITDDWLYRKMRMGASTKIGTQWGRLRASMSEVEGPDQDVYIGPTSMHLGSHLKWAGPFNARRPFNEVAEKDRLAIRGIIRKHLMEAWETSNL